MARRNFRQGELYFILWYADAEMLYLSPDSIVFIGKDLDPSQSEETWYFQDARSYCEAPPRDPASPILPVDQGEPVGTIYRFHAVELSQITDLEGLAAEVEKCRERRKRANSPA